MFIGKYKKSILFLAVSWIACIFVLGGWWLYLIRDLGQRVGNHAGKSRLENINLNSLVIWEGGFFFLLLLFLSFVLVFLYLQDLNRSKSLQAFFASLTHELKTPLASIRLQSEVIHQMLHDKLPENTQNKIHNLYDRLIEDTQYLENELDKILHLSRTIQGGKLTTKKIEIENFVKEFIPKNADHIHHVSYKISGPENNEQCVQAEDMALTIILRNLLENTLKHNQNSKKEIDISIKDQPEAVVIEYRDNGEPFKGDSKKLGNLFYKFESSKGSGIGLYLCKKLAAQMGGKFSVLQDNNLNLVFQLLLKKSSNL